MKEYKTDVVQFLDGCDDTHHPHPPKGEGWRLAHVAAASGRISPPVEAQLDADHILCALIFYVWEREVVDPRLGPSDRGLSDG